jgi:hypothetical protein
MTSEPTPDPTAPRVEASELEELRAWKESAMTCMNRLDLQAVGRALGVPLGRDVWVNILPGIQRLTSELAAAKEALGGFASHPFDGGLVTGINALSMRCAASEAEAAATASRLAEALEVERVASHVVEMWNKTGPNQTLQYVADSIHRLSDALAATPAPAPGGLPADRARVEELEGLILVADQLWEAGEELQICTDFEKENELSDAFDGMLNRYRRERKSLAPTAAHPASGDAGKAGTES